jgi:hypothetical protein
MAGWLQRLNKIFFSNFSSKHQNSHFHPCEEQPCFESIAEVLAFRHHLTDIAKCIFSIHRIYSPATVFNFIVDWLTK